MWNSMEHYRRLASAAILVPPVAAFLVYAPRELFGVLVGVVIGVSLHEYFRLLALKHQPLCVGLSYIAALSLACLTHFYGLQGLSLSLSLNVVLLTGGTIWQADPSVPSFPALVYSLFGVLLIGWGLSHLILIRSLDVGRLFIILLCAVVWLSDAAAMYVGQALGRHRMAPAISPGKTWEGAAASLVSGMIVAWLGVRLLSLPLSLLQSVAFGGIISCVAQVSDLSESLLKRYVGVKDSGALIPGHGGLLDRIDSLCLSAPLAFYLLRWLTEVYGS
jgi:phosphatidate cytidylyltransferase